MGESRCVLYVPMMHQLKAWQVASMSHHGCEHVTASLLHVVILSVSVQTLPNLGYANGVLAILYSCFSWALLPHFCVYCTVGTSKTIRSVSLSKIEIRTTPPLFRFPSNSK